MNWFREEDGKLIWEKITRQYRYNRGEMIVSDYGQQ